MAVIKIVGCSQIEICYHSQLVVATGMDPFRTLKSGRFVLFIEIWDHIQPYIYICSARRLKSEDPHPKRWAAFSCSRARTTAEGYASLALQAPQLFIFLSKHAPFHTYLSAIIRLTSLSTLYNSGDGQMERNAQLQARVVNAGRITLTNSTKWSIFRR